MFFQLDKKRNFTIKREGEGESVVRILIYFLPTLFTSLNG